MSIIILLRCFCTSNTNTLTCKNASNIPLYKYVTAIDISTVSNDDKDITEDDYEMIDSVTANVDTFVNIDWAGVSYECGAGCGVEC